MNQPQTQTRQYWVKEFVIDDADIDQIYNHLLEVERPQTAYQIAGIIIAHRVAREENEIRQLMRGRTVYQPKDSHEIGDELVFPVMRYAQGVVRAIRPGYDPNYGHFNVIAVEIGGKSREFVSELPGEHQLNLANGETFEPMIAADLDALTGEYGTLVSQAVDEALKKRTEFVRLGNKWFVRALMAEVNIGHLHLAEAVLEVSGGGPLPTKEIVVHLDMDPGVNEEVRLFSLDFALSKDNRFDEVGPPGKVEWFLHRLEPEGVRTPPERLRNSPIHYDRALLGPELLLLERELDDEWSELAAELVAQPTILSLTYPHRWAGTLPLSSRVRPLFPTGLSPRQRVVLLDEQTNEEIVGWLVQEFRYIFGLSKWYEENSIPVGGFITLKPGPEAGVVLIDYDRRRPQREWVRLASVVDNQLAFDLERRSVGCGYDDLLIVGTDYVAALDVLARRFEANQYSLASILTAIFPRLAKLTPQETAHAKTLYSAVNMVRRVPPGPLFAELVRNPAFQPVGDHYWFFDKNRAR